MPLTRLALTTLLFLALALAACDAFASGRNRGQFNRNAQRGRQFNQFARPHHNVQRGNVNRGQFRQQPFRQQQQRHHAF